MPNWNKVIISGSSAALTSVTATAGLVVTGSTIITGSLSLTGSFNQASASLATGLFAHAQGFNVTASGAYSHAEGYNTSAAGPYSHAEGNGTIASGSYSHAQGQLSFASGQYAHAEGYNVKAHGSWSHAEGEGTVASGSYSHAEGTTTTALGSFSHAEGYYTIVSGNYAHAEGRSTTAIGPGSHAEGWGTVASGSYQHVQGQYNRSSSVESAFIVGNGTSDAVRSNLIFAVGSQVQVTGSVIATAGFTGSLQGTATMASQSGYTMQFVLATTGSNPSPGTNYYMGAPMQNKFLTKPGLTRIYVPRPGKVKYAHVWIKNSSAATSGTSSFYLHKTTAAGATLSEQIESSGNPGFLLSASVVSTATSMSVVQGDYLHVVWKTPGLDQWTTSPKAVEGSAIIYIENNI